MRTISTLLALLCVAPLIRTLAGPLDFWTRTLSSTNSYVQQGCGIYANGRWVVSMSGVSGGTNMTLLSEDAATWRMVREQAITQLTSGNGLIVGFATSTGTIVSSSDGVRWISKLLPIPGPPTLMFGMGRFWAHVAGFPAPNEHVMLHSSDALEWTIAWTNKWKLVSQVADGVSRVRFPAFCHDRFFTIVEGPSQDWAPGVEVLESTNGIDFRPSPTWPMLRSIAHLSGTWVGVLTTNPGMVAVSMDGATWTNIVPHFRFSYSGVLKTTGERFLANSDANYFWSSKDGLNWTDHEVDLRFTTAWEGLRVQDLVPGSDR